MSVLQNNALKIILEKHLDIWNHTEEATLRAAIDGIYAPKVRMADPAKRYKGPDGITEAVLQFRKQYPGAVQRVKGTPSVHHNGACYTWEVAVADQPALMTGTAFILLKEGLIKTIYLFNDK